MANTQDIAWFSALVVILFTWLTVTYFRRLRQQSALQRAKGEEPCPHKETVLRRAWMRDEYPWNVVYRRDQLASALLLGDEELCLGCGARRLHTEHDTSPWRAGTESEEQDLRLQRSYEWHKLDKEIHEEFARAAHAMADEVEQIRRSRKQLFVDAATQHQRRQSWEKAGHLLDSIRYATFQLTPDALPDCPHGIPRATRCWECSPR